MATVHHNFFKRFYLFIHEKHREREREREAEHRQREKQACCREPDPGLDPGTPESHPEPKADAQLLSHPGVPNFTVLMSINKYKNYKGYVENIRLSFQLLNPPTPAPDNPYSTFCPQHSDSSGNLL